MCNFFVAVVIEFFPGMIYIGEKKRQINRDRQKKRERVKERRRRECVLCVRRRREKEKSPKRNAKRSTGHIEIYNLGREINRQIDRQIDRQIETLERP